jgi:hypothetical protein
VKVYAIRKREGRWAVCADDNVLLQFDTYDEAVETARSAAGVLANRRAAVAQRDDAPRSGFHPMVNGRCGPGRKQPILL